MAGGPVEGTALLRQPGLSGGTTGPSRRAANEFEVRCAEGDGTPQIERATRNHPDGGDRYPQQRGPGLAPNSSGLRTKPRLVATARASARYRRSRIPGSSCMSPSQEVPVRCNAVSAILIKGEAADALAGCGRNRGLMAEPGDVERRLASFGPSGWSEGVFTGCYERIMVPASPFRRLLGAIRPR